MTEENFQPKIHQLTDKKDVVILNSDDQNPDLERLKGFNQDLENPDLADKSRIEYPDLSAVKETLAKTGYELLGDRQIASGAIFGKLFKLRVKDLKTGEEKDVLERVFSRNKGIDNRFLEYKADPGLIIEENPRYQTVDREKQEPINIIVDRLYNEEMALSDLQNIPGIPKFYASVDDGKCGSVFQEFIDGYDLSLAIDDKNITEASTVIDIFEKIKKTYIAAAEKGYIHNRPIGSTIMVDPRTNQPYFTDGYLYSRGSIATGAGPVYERYLSGLADIDNKAKAMLSELS